MRIAFFASGNGSTFQSLVECIRAEKIAAEPALLICTKDNAYVLERALSLGIPCEIIARRNYHDGAAHAAAMLETLEKFNCDWIFLCGYMELVPPQVVSAFRNKIVNIHPALLPAFGGKGMYGARVHEAVLNYGAKVTGATVHFVDEEYDHGPVIAQQVVMVRPDDTVERLGERVQNAEKNLYRGALKVLASGKYEINGRIVKFIP
ncbi:phosphoribosylglycinamide formyltransferase [bacterium]|nr:phosphoribosylglycinamide formyltransferase [bacterium]